LQKAPRSLELGAFVLLVNAIHSTYIGLFFRYIYNTISETMKKLSASLLFLLIFAGPLLAQDIQEEDQVISRFGVWTSEDESQTAYVFSEIANVRMDDDVKSAIAGKLKIGAAVKILGISPVDFTQSGITAPWVEIETVDFSGFIWGGVLAKGPRKLDNNRTVLWGLTAIQTDKDGIEKTFASIRICENGTLISKQDFEVAYGDRPDEGYLTIQPAPLIENIRYLITFETLSEACGVFASSHYFLYAENQLNFVGSGYSMGDGGMLHTSRTFYFPYPPKENEDQDYHFVPTAGHIFRVEDEGSYDEECIWVATQKVADFIWNGEALVKSCEE